MSVPDVHSVTVYLKTHWADIFQQNGPSSPFRPVYPLIYPRDSHVRKIMWEASFIHDGGYWILRLPGSPYEHVTRKEWDQAYRNHIRDNGHPIVAAMHYRALRAMGGLAWQRNWRRMVELGYEDLEAWAAIKRGQAISLR